MNGISRGNTRLERALAVAALVLSVLAAFAMEPNRTPADEGERGIDWSAVDHVEPRQLAAWLMERRDDLRLLDLRPGGQYDEYHIPTARRGRAAETDAPADPEQAVTVIYHWNSASALAAADSLRQYRAGGVYVLKGGLNGWIDEVLFPDLAARPGMNGSEREEIRRTSLYFGGKPKLGEFDRSSPGRRYLREGC